MKVQNREKTAWIAFLCSLILPGGGQLYNRTGFRGILWLIVGLSLWLTIGSYAVVCHLFSAVTAYNYAARKMGQEEVWPDL